MVMIRMMLLCAVIGLYCFAVYWYARMRHRAALSHHASSPVTRFVLVIGMETNRCLHVIDWLMQYAPGVVRSVGLLHRGNPADSDETIHIWAAQITASMIGLLLASSAASAMLGDAALMGTGVLLSLAMPVVAWRDLERRVKERYRQFLTELPVFIHKMSLLIGAGETVQGAWIRASVPAKKDVSHPLYLELRRMRNELAQTVTFAKSMELFAGRCGVPEVSYLVTTTLMNYRRGGETFALILQQTGRTMVEKKRTVLKTMGEEATAKLVFPMVIIFAMLMVVVAAPAIMLMNQGL
jgi:tight adherence protein C